MSSDPGSIARRALIQHLAKPRDIAAARAWRTSMEFINERGNQITVATEIHGDMIRLELTGPDSQTTLEITVMEADASAQFLASAVKRAKRARGRR